MNTQTFSIAPAAKPMTTNIIAWIATAYSYLALYSSGEQALMLGGVATIFGYTLFSFVNNRLIALEAHNNSVPTQTVSAQHITGEPVPVNHLKAVPVEVRS